MSGPATYQLNGVTYQVAPGTVFYSTLDSTTADLSGAGNDLLAVGNPSFPASAPPGFRTAAGGFNGDGADYFAGTPALNAALTRLSSFTVEFYVLGNGAAACSSLIDFGSDTSDAWEIGPCIPNYPNFYWSYTQAGARHQINAALAGGYTAGEWYFMSCQYDAVAGTLKVFANGSLLAASAPFTASSFPGPGSLSIGKNGLSGGSVSTNLNLSQLRILNYATGVGSRTLDAPVPTPTPSPSPSATPTASPSATASASMTASPSTTATCSPSATPSPRGSATASPSVTTSPSATPSSTVTPATYVLNGTEYAVAPQTVFYSTLDGSISDLSGNHADLIAYGTPHFTASAPPGFGTALGDFPGNGSSYLAGSLSLNATLAALGSFTIQFYVQGTGTATCSTLLDFGSDTSDAWSIAPCIPNYSNFYWTLASGGAKEQINADLASDFAAGQWYFMSFQYDAPSGVMKAFTNGILAATSSAFKVGPFPGSPSLTLGKNGFTGSGEATNLSISQLRILSYATGDGAQVLDTPLGSAPGASGVQGQARLAGPKGGTPGPTSTFRIGGASSSPWVCPNPARDRATLYFDTDQIENGEITVSDLTGSTVLHHALGAMEAGSHTTTFDLTPWAAGIYFVSLRVEVAGTWRNQGIFKLAVIH